MNTHIQHTHTQLKDFKKVFFTAGGRNKDLNMCKDFYCHIIPLFFIVYQQNCLLFSPFPLINPSSVRLWREHLFHTASILALDSSDLALPFVSLICLFFISSPSLATASASSTLPPCRCFLASLVQQGVTGSIQVLNLDLLVIYTHGGQCTG